MKKNKGFTLMELMIVVAIMGILGAVGYPTYINAVQKSNRADAIDSLLSLASRMEEYYLINDSYAGATVAADGSGTVGSNQTSASLYTLSVPAATATAFGYSITATPVGTDAECATLSLDNLGQKSATGTDATNCW